MPEFQWPCPTGWNTPWGWCFSTIPKCIYQNLHALRALEFKLQWGKPMEALSQQNSHNNNPFCEGEVVVRACLPSWINKCWNNFGITVASSCWSITLGIFGENRVFQHVSASFGAKFQKVHTPLGSTQTFAGIGGSSPSLSCSCQAWEMMASRVAAVPLAEAAVVEAEDDEPRSAIGTPESVKQCLVRIDRKALPRTGQRSWEWTAKKSRLGKDVPLAWCRANHSGGCGG